MAASSATSTSESTGSSTEPSPGWSERWVARIAPPLLRGLVGLLGWTYRFRVIEGREHLDVVVNNEAPRVLTLWHNRLIPGATFLLRHLARRGARLVTLASLSGDGALITRVLEGWGIQVVRGSSSRGGFEAIRRLHGLVRSEGVSVVLTPDGPRGPLYEFKLGAAVLAQATSSPVLPIGLAARRFATVGSWDRMIVPWPFTRIIVVVGQPILIPRGLDAAERERFRLRVEEEQSSLTRRAEASLGVSDPTTRDPVSAENRTTEKDHPTGEPDPTRAPNRPAS